MTALSCLKGGRSTLRCVAIDDEPLALDTLSRYSQQYGEIELETYSSPMEGLMRIKAWKPDVVLLDMKANREQGMEVAGSLPPGCGLIITTAYAQYALDGFDLNAIDFLLKPFFYKRFCSAMQKAERWLQMNNLLWMSTSEQRQILLKSDYKQVPVGVDSIVYIESVGNYVKLHLADGSRLMSKLTMHRLLELLPQKDFLRIHRSFIVAVGRIERFSSTSLTVGGKGLPIGKKYVDEVIERVQALPCR